MVVTAHIPLLGQFNATTGTTGLFRSCSGFDEAEIIVNVVTLTGTSPTVTPILEGFMEYGSQFAGSTQVYTIFTFTLISAVGNATKLLGKTTDPVLPRNIRCRTTTTGTITALSISVEMQLRATSGS